MTTNSAAGGYVCSQAVCCALLSCGVSENGEGSGVCAPNPSFTMKRVFLTRAGSSLRSKAPRTYQPACKPGSVGYRALAPAIRDGHSSGTTFARCLMQPTRTAGPTRPCDVIAKGEPLAMPSLFGFAPGVVCHAVPVAGGAVRSYRTFSPLPSPPYASPASGGGWVGEAVRSLWHCPWGRPRRMLSGTVCRWSPDFPLPQPFGRSGSGHPAD